MSEIEIPTRYCDMMRKGNFAEMRLRTAVIPVIVWIARQMSDYRRRTKMKNNIKIKSIKANFEKPLELKLCSCCLNLNITFLLFNQDAA